MPKLLQRISSEGIVYTGDWYFSSDKELICNLTIQIPTILSKNLGYYRYNYDLGIKLYWFPDKWGVVARGGIPTLTQLQDFVSGNWPYHYTSNHISRVGTIYWNESKEQQYIIHNHKFVISDIDISQLTPSDNNDITNHNLGNMLALYYYPGTQKIFKFNNDMPWLTTSFHIRNIKIEYNTTGWYSGSQGTESTNTTFKKFLFYQSDYNSGEISIDFIDDPSIDLLNEPNLPVQGKDTITSSYETFVKVNEIDIGHTAFITFPYYIYSDIDIIPQPCYFNILNNTRQTFQGYKFLINVNILGSCWYTEQFPQGEDQWGNIIWGDPIQITYQCGVSYTQEFEIPLITTFKPNYIHSIQFDDSNEYISITHDEDVQASYWLSPVLEPELMSSLEFNIYESFDGVIKSNKITTGALNYSQHAINYSDITTPYIIIEPIHQFRYYDGRILKTNQDNYSLRIPWITEQSSPFYYFNKTNEAYEALLPYRFIDNEWQLISLDKQNYQHN